MFFANLGAKTSLSGPNWCLDWRTIESITYNPGILYSGLLKIRWGIMIFKWLRRVIIMRYRNGWNCLSIITTCISGWTFRHFERRVCNIWSTVSPLLWSMSFLPWILVVWFHIEPWAMRKKCMLYHEYPILLQFKFIRLFYITKMILTSWLNSFTASILF